MRLLLFLGAGVSVPSGLPTAAGLTASLLKLPRSKPRDSAGHSKSVHWTYLSAANDVDRIPRFLRLLKAYDDADIKKVGYARRGTRARYQATTAIFRNQSTYEDLFFLCQQIKDWGRGWSDDCLATPLMEALERRGRELFLGRSLRARLSDVASVGTAASDYIEARVAKALNSSKPVGFELIGGLASAPQIEQLNIVTLNHDTLVEQFLTSQGIPFIDGFGQPDGDVRWYVDGVYDAPAKVRLFKLHGSIDWFMFSTVGRTAQLVGGDPLAAHDALGRGLKLLSPGPSFLSGQDKAVSYQRGIYADVHHRFHELLRQGNRMVMCGYGWGDRAINCRLEAWMDDPRGNELLLLHPDPGELEWRSLVVVTSFEAWIRSKRLIPLKKWLFDARIEELSDFLNEREQA
jgi:hypothetical protein